MGFYSYLPLRILPSFPQHPLSIVKAYMGTDLNRGHSINKDFNPGFESCLIDKHDWLKSMPMNSLAMANCRAE